MGATLHSLVRQGRAFSGKERNCSFLNLQNGTFADVSAVSGFDFPDDGRAVAQVDWDFDGDLDYWIANRNGPQVRYLRNDLATDNHFISVLLEGKDCNRDAIGARVEVNLPDPQQTRLLKTLRAGEGFLSQSSKSLHFGLGDTPEKVEIVVHWPGGEKESFGQVSVDRHYRLTQHTGKPELRTGPNKQVTLQPSELASPKAEATARIVSSAQLPMPTLEYKSFDGDLLKLSRPSTRGPVLVNLWASWCRSCLAELKEFSQHNKELESAGIDVLALSVDKLDVKQSGTEVNAAELLENLGYQGKAGWATENTTEIIRLVQEHLFDFRQPMSLPTSILIDSEGRLAAIYRGPVSVEQLTADTADLGEDTVSRSPPFPGKWRMRQHRLSPLDLVWQLVEMGYLEEAGEYVREYKSLVEPHYNAPKLFVLIGNAELGRGNAAKAISHYRDALRLDVDYDEAQNNLAWILATHPNKELRDGEEALQLALAAVKQQRGNAVSMLATLSAALAETGRFEEAARVAVKAVELARKSGQEQVAIDIEKRIEGYRQGKPHRSH